MPKSVDYVMLARNHANVRQPLLTRWIHLLADLDPEYPLFASCAFMAADIYGAGHLLQVWARCCGETCRERILRKKRFSYCCEACGRSRLVFWVCTWIYRNLDPKIRDNLICCTAALTGLEWRQRFDLKLVSLQAKRIRAGTYIWLLLKHVVDTAKG